MQYQMTLSKTIDRHSCLTCNSLTIEQTKWLLICHFKRLIDSYAVVVLYLVGGRTVTIFCRIFYHFVPDGQ